MVLVLIVEMFFFATENDVCKTQNDCVPPLACSGGKCQRQLFNIPCNKPLANCSTNNEERCICDQRGGSVGTCKQTANPSCSFISTSKRWADCWRANNCHWERNIFTSMITEMFG